MLHSHSNVDQAHKFIILMHIKTNEGLKIWLTMLTASQITGEFFVEVHYTSSWFLFENNHKYKFTDKQNKYGWNQNKCELCRAVFYLRQSWRTNDPPFPTNFHSTHSNVPAFYYFTTTKPELETWTLSCRVKLLIVVFQTPDIIHRHLLNNRPLSQHHPLNKTVKEIVKFSSQPHNPFPKYSI